VAELAVQEEGDIVGGTHMDIVTGHLVRELGGNGAGLGDLLGFQAFSFEHIKKVGIAAEVQLVGLLQFDAAVDEELGKDAVDNGSADLGLDIIADDGEAVVGETGAPVGAGADEDRDAVDETATGLEDLFDIPLGSGLGADGQVVEDDVGLGLLEEFDDIGGGARGLLNDLGEVFTEAVMGHAASDFDAGGRDVAELEGVVREGVDSLGEVLADFILIDIDGRHEFDITDVVTAQIDMHETRDGILLPCITVVIDALHQG